jgi:hypothetical protein
MRSDFLTLAAALAFAMAAPTAGAAKVYKWLGSDGVTYYSETAPGSRPGEVETIELVEPDLVQAPAPDYQSVLEVARDIEASRLERERMRLEQQKLRLEQARSMARSDREYPESRSYFPIYPYYLRKHPRPHQFRRGPRPHPYRGWNVEPRPWSGGAGHRARVPGFGGP